METFNPNEINVLKESASAHWFNMNLQNIDTELKHSGIIEGVLLRLPFPVTVVTKKVGDKYELVTAHTVVAAFINFINNRYELQGLKVMDHLNGCYFNDLPTYIKRRLQEYFIAIVFIAPGVPPAAEQYVIDFYNNNKNI